MALIVVESDASQAKATALFSRQPIKHPYQLDDFQGIGGGVANTTTTYAYDSGNRQTSMTLLGVTTSNGYDDWGRLTTSARGGVTTRYTWRYGSKLYSVDSNNDGTPEVTYKTGGDGKRRARITAASETWYNWDSGFTVISEETGSSGTGARKTGDCPQRSEAETGLSPVLPSRLDGTNPATGTWRYMHYCDQRNDRRGNGGQSRLRSCLAPLGTVPRFLPYGQMDAWSGTANATTRLFTGHDRDPLTGQDYSPDRWYASAISRWISPSDTYTRLDGSNPYAAASSESGGHPFDVVRNIMEQIFDRELPEPELRWISYTNIWCYDSFPKYNSSNRIKHEIECRWGMLRCKLQAQEVWAVATSALSTAVMLAKVTICANLPTSESRAKCMEIVNKYERIAQNELDANLEWWLGKCEECYKECMALPM